MGYMEVYKSWCDNMYFDEATRDELKSIANDEKEIEDTFAQEEELQTKSARLAELDALLNMEHQSSRTEPEAEEKPDARPSVLEDLSEKGYARANAMLFWAYYFGYEDYPGDPQKALIYAVVLFRNSFVNFLSLI